MVISNDYELAKSRVSAFLIQEFSIICYILHPTSERAGCLPKYTSQPILSLRFERLKLFNSIKRNWQIFKDLDLSIELGV